MQSKKNGARKRQGSQRNRFRHVKSKKRSPTAASESQLPINNNNADTIQLTFNRNESLQSPTEPPKDYFPMVGRQSLAKELNALAESDDTDDDDTPQNQTHLRRTSDEQHRGAILFHYINTFACAPPEDWGDWYVDKQKAPHSCIARAPS